MAKNSPIDAVHAAIQSHNIFSKAGIVREQNVWGRGFPDVPSLNHHASDTVLKALEQVRTTDDKVTSLVITAQQGQGKTHLLNRIRRQLLQESDFAFIYANVLSYTDLNQVHVYFLRTITESLSRDNHEGVTQWQMIASAMMNSVVKNKQSAKSFVRKFDQVHQAYLNKGQNLLDALTAKIREQKPGIDPYIIRAVIGTLSGKASSYAEKWLVGEQLEDSHAKYLGLPSHSQHLNHNQEKTALSFIKQILSLIGEYIVPFSSVLMNWKVISTMKVD
ncbi:KAP family NTPase [Spirulina subsalsa FACHB-351]|uniref:KAP family NTPase n=1 Tax=Spirulina subsalsa FACHB-351 TaxID=234711 RepID=A0ABT3L1M7_9CYAN|nr:KAP family NTPase [Spirulina subsalsa]MCW6035386.1 KAP family NTPase [Spirulina subsalsa FACHB-351]